MPPGSFEEWLVDYHRRLARREDCVTAIARDIASSTDWTVRARGAPGFRPPHGDNRDVECERGASPRYCLTVEVMESLVRRETLRRLQRLTCEGHDSRVVLVADEEDHEQAIAGARRLLERAGLRLPVVAISPDRPTITGADWRS